MLVRCKCKSVKKGEKSLRLGKKLKKKKKGLDAARRLVLDGA